MAVDAARGRGEAFTSARAAEVMVAACRAVGLPDRDAELIRFGENGLFRLVSAPVIVRVARSSDHLPAVRKEVAVSRWLAEEGFPAARVLEDLEEPLIVDGYPVTFWHLIVEGERGATYAELGAVLRDLHALKLPDGLELPRYGAFAVVERRLDRAVGIPEEDLRFLRQHGEELKDRLAALRFESPLGPVHGDAHTDNLLVDRDGVVHLIDFETFCVDHPEWDLEVAAHEYDRLGWVTDGQYADFVRAYGRDLRQWSGFETLCAVQEFKMTTWLMQNVSEGEEVAEEVSRRIASLRDDRAPRNWLPY